MSLILAQSFVKQLKRLPQKEQGVVSRTVLDLQIDPTASTLSLHKVDGNAGWWSAYANGDLRIILARQGEGDLVLCWTDHHDKAYLWARNHVLSQHPVTGAMQLVEIPEVVAPQSDDNVEAEPKKRRVPICEKLSVGREKLLGWGIPEAWVERVLSAVDEDELLEIGEKHLPIEVAEIVLGLAVGELPEEKPEDDNPQPANPWSAQGWWVISEDDDLKAALENRNWDTWCVYLHPSQRKISYKTYNGPYRVCGSAGTGKTVVALHHAKHVLESDPMAQVAVLTYSGVLATDLKRRCRALLTPRALERCEVRSLAEFARRLYDAVFPNHDPIIHRVDVRMKTRDALRAMRDRLPKGISPAFAMSEFERVVEPRQITSEDAYIKTVRRGVHTRMSGDRRRALWKVMQELYEAIREDVACVTTDQMFGQLAKYYAQHPEAPRLFTHIVVDECQDLCEVELDFLTAYLGEKGCAFFAGDIGQRIIHYSFPWKPHGIDLRGRSRVLKVNYRTTHEIRSMADRLTSLDDKDADEIDQKRRGTVSLLSGPKPELQQFDSVEAEIDGVADWLDHLCRDLNIPAEAVAVFIRSDRALHRAVQAVDRSLYAVGPIKPIVTQMFQAKGLEYRAAVVMACDNDIIPDPDRIAEADLVAGLEEIYDTERNLLYVACTRARDYLLVTSSGVPSELLLDMV